MKRFNELSKKRQLEILACVEGVLSNRYSGIDLDELFEEYLHLVVDYYKDDKNAVNERLYSE